MTDDDARIDGSSGCSGASGSCGPDGDDPPEWDEPEDCTDEELGLGTPFPAWVLEFDRRRDRQVRERWRYLPDDPLPESPPVGTATVGTIVRALRWRTRLSQRELATAASVPRSAVSRAEQAGGSDPRLSTLERLVGACGLRLAVVDEEGTQLAIPFDQDRRRDRADRALPAHRGHPVNRHSRAVGLERPRPPSLRAGWCVLLPRRGRCRCGGGRRRGGRGAAVRRPRRGPRRGWGRRPWLRAPGRRC